MGETPDQLKAEAATTRADMTATLHAIADRANPRNAARRRVDRVGRRFAGVRDAVMGTLDDVTSGVTNTASSLSEGSQSAMLQAPQALQRQTRGNPIAAGVIAFGAGLLTASLLPSTEPERRAASTIGDQAQPLVDHAQDAARQVAQELKSSAQDAAAQVKDTAADAAQQLRDHAGGAAAEVGGHAQSAASDVRAAATDQS